MLWHMQLTRPVFCRPSRHWSLHLRTSLSRTLGCSMNFSAVTFWPEDRSTTFAVRERSSEGTTRCSTCWHQKSSASSFWQPCSELVNNMWSTSSHRMEVTKHTDIVTYNGKCIIWWRTDKLQYIRFPLSHVFIIFQVCVHIVNSHNHRRFVYKHQTVTLRLFHSGNNCARQCML